MRLRLTRKRIDKAIAKGEEAKLWDEKQRGLCLRVRAGSGKAYFGVEYRNADGMKEWETIGGFGETIDVDGNAIPLTVETRTEGGRAAARPRHR